MKQTEKENYVKDWEDYLNAISALYWVHDKELYKEIKTHVDALKELVPKVADDKIYNTQKAVVE